MSYIQITKWVPQDQNLWWRDVNEIFELVTTSDEATNEIYFDYVEKFLLIRGVLTTILTHHFREKHDNGVVYTCVIFDSLEKIEEYENFKNTEIFLNYVSSREKLLNLWGIDMNVKNPVLMVEDPAQAFEDKNYLMNKFNENYNY